MDLGIFLWNKKKKIHPAQRWELLMKEEFHSVLMEGETTTWGKKRKKRKNKFKTGLRNIKMNDEELSAALTVRRGHWQLK